MRGFVLIWRRSQSTQDSLDLLERWWRNIEGLVTDRPDGPWMYSVTTEGVRAIEL